METVTGNGMIAEDQFLGANETREFIIRSLGATRKGGVWRRSLEMACQRGPVLGANETREFIIRSLGATRKGGGRNGNDTRVASTARCNQGELS